jgi:aminodeoxyfutalosine synthase
MSAVPGDGQLASDPSRSELRDLALLEVELKIADGLRLTRDDAITLEHTSDLPTLFDLADRVRRARHGDIATWVANIQLNPTNVCILTCRFCEFAVRLDSKQAYVIDPEAAPAMAPAGTREVHIVGGLHPRWEQDDYFAYIRAFRIQRPEIGIKAFTAVEVDFLARKARKTTVQILREMKDAGVEILPGGGAEVLVERIHDELFPHKIGADDWLRIHREAHEEGLKSNTTLLFGHIETAEERVDHLLKLRSLQDQTGGFLCYIPLVYQPGATRLRSEILPMHERLRQIAIGRLVLDNFPSIKAYWTMLGLATTVRALQCGADDMDGTIGQERIAHAAAAETPVGLLRRDIEALCRDSGFIPVERDHLHRRVNTAEQPE